MAVAANESAVRTPAPQGQSAWIVSGLFDLAFIANLGWLLVWIPALLGDTGESRLQFWQVYFLTTPHRWLTHQRILSAQQLLEKTDRPIDWIAESVGLQTAATLREHFRRMLKTTPTAYRRAFFVAGQPGRTTKTASPSRSSRLR